MRAQAIMGTTLPLNEKDGEISPSGLWERKASSSESLKNNGIFQKFDESECNDGGEKSQKTSVSAEELRCAFILISP